MVQIYRREADNTLGDAITSGVQGFMGGRELRRKNQERQLADALTMMKIQKYKSDIESLNNPIPTNPMTNQPAGFTYGGKFYQYKAPTQRQTDPFKQAGYEAAVESGVDSEGKPMNSIARAKYAQVLGYEPYEQEPAKQGGWFGMGAKPAVTGYRPRIEVLQGPGGTQPKVMDQLDLEAHNAINAGADPVQVRARLAQMRAQRGSV